MKQMDFIQFILSVKIKKNMNKFEKSFKIKKIHNNKLYFIYSLIVFIFFNLEIYEYYNYLIKMTKSISFSLSIKKKEFSYSMKLLIAIRHI